MMRGRGGMRSSSCNAGFVRCASCLAGGPGRREGTQALGHVGTRALETAEARRARGACGGSGVVTTAEPEGAAHGSTT